jgi:hypothetical protein
MVIGKPLHQERTKYQGWRWCLFTLRASQSVGFEVTLLRSGRTRFPAADWSKTQGTGPTILKSTKTRTKQFFACERKQVDSGSIPAGSFVRAARQMI